MWFAGIDWADAEHEICLLNERGKEAESFTVPHSAAGFSELRSRLLKHAGSPEQVACVIETTHGLLIAFLLESGFPVYPVNPKMVDGRRKPSGAKTDPIDARLLAKIGFSDLDELRRLQPDSEIIRELKVLTQDQDRLVLHKTRLNNQLTAALKEYYPAALSLFYSVDQPVTLAFLQAYPTLEKARTAKVDELYAFYRKHYTGATRAGAEELYAKIHQVWPAGDPAVVRARERYVISLCRQLEVVLADVNAYDKAIRELFRTHPDHLIFASLPCGGPRLAVRLLAGWGDDRSRFQSAASVQALAGTCAVARKSGKRLNRPKRRRACLKWLQRALQLFAFQTSLNIAWCREYYEKKRAEGKGHHEALRCLANIWVRIIHAMWLKHETYSEVTFLQAQKLHTRAA
jgi:transposase